MTKEDIKQIGEKFLEIISASENKKFDEISDNDKQYILERSNKLHKSMKENGLEVENKILGVTTKQIEFLSTIFNEESIYNLYKTQSLYKLQLRKIVNKIREFVKSLDEKRKEEYTIMKDNREVFVIHGRNLQIRDSFFEYLRHLDLKPISFEKAKQLTGKGSPYNLEIIDEVITEEMTIISIMTPDDIAYMNPFFHKPSDSEREKKPTGQARLNVIFETGYAFAKNRAKIILIIFGDMRNYSDIDGINKFYFQDTPEKRTDLKNLLSSIGCPISEDSSYLSCGNFEIDPEIFQNIPRTPEYTSTKSDIINSVKILKDLSVRAVRNNIDTDLEILFSENLDYIKKFPDIMAMMPDSISEETNPHSLHQIFKEKGGYSIRVNKITEEFDNTLIMIRALNI